VLWGRVSRHEGRVPFDGFNVVTPNGGTAGADAPANAVVRGWCQSPGVPGTGRDRDLAQRATSTAGNELPATTPTFSKPRCGSERCSRALAEGEEALKRPPPGWKTARHPTPLYNKRHALRLPLAPRGDVAGRKERKSRGWRSRLAKRERSLGVVGTHYREIRLVGACPCRPAWGVKSRTLQAETAAEPLLPDAHGGARAISLPIEYSGHST